MQQPLNELTKEEIREAFEKQVNTGWTFYSERELLENAINNQANFIHVVFGIVIAATFNSEKAVNKSFILGFGIVTIISLWFSMYRVYKRWETVLKVLYCLEDWQVVQMLSREVKYFGAFASHPTTWYRANLIPILYISALLILLLVFAFTKMFEVACFIKMCKCCY